MSDGKFCFYVTLCNDVKYLVSVFVDSLSRIKVFDYTVSHSIHREKLTLLRQQVSFAKIQSKRRTLTNGGKKLSKLSR